MTDVFDVLKTAEYNQNSAIQPEQETSRDDCKFNRRGADDNSPYAQEPCAVKVARTVLKWGRGQR